MDAEAGSVVLVEHAALSSAVAQSNRIREFMSRAYTRSLVAEYHQISDKLMAAIDLPLAVHNAPGGFVCGEDPRHSFFQSQQAGDPHHLIWIRAEVRLADSLVIYALSQQ
jgi:hypothetical protein